MTEDARLNESPPTDESPEHQEIPSDFDEELYAELERRAAEGLDGAMSWSQVKQMR